MAVPVWRRPLPRLVFGLILFGVGVAAMVAADLGLGPWDVLHQGVSNRTGIPIGTVSIGVSALVLLGWIPLRERPGLGTICNVILIGATVDVTLLVLTTPASLAGRIALMLSGPVLIAIGSGYYLGAGRGAGPRDGLMTGLARRGWPVGVARAAVEVTALAVGWALGGSVGVGTLVFAASIGPLVQLAVPRLRVPDGPRRRRRGLGAAR